MASFEDSLVVEKKPVGIHWDEFFLPPLSLSFLCVVKMFAQHKDDKKRVEKALEACGFASGKNDAIPPDKFTSDVFFNFYRHLAGRDEVDRIFEKL
ncbi:hypothetical protein AVEN_240528-1 [Araneus ventricosus]|uniref:Phosphoinositide phospholipase C beta 1-4-like EF-hand domain-containing protein n=1 Tax=Araneus ventricosus TaxID=182803 RepID=A0A4Y2L5T2_ARAVE|nr:hypothetical protein AVEN_240528-1 [Araneus ventricosus]